MITHIFWDYNGTVVNDVLASVLAVNDMLYARGLLPTDINTYKDTIDMPLDNYYKTIGIFDKIPTLSVEFRQGLKNHQSHISIFDGVKDIIDYFNNKGVKSILLSSLYHEFLVEDTKKHGIDSWFFEIMGTNNKSVGSKLENAKTIMKKYDILPQNALFVGDLKSDAELAKTLGAQCVLISNGHMSHNRLCQSGVKVLKDVREIKDIL